MITINNIFLFLLVFIFSSCSMNSGFYFYNTSGDLLSINENRALSTKSVSLYFDREEINEEYIEINIIESNHHHYGDFYFDEVFMKTLNKKVSLIDADALIFEKNMSQFSFYKKDCIYFTAIKFK